MRYCKKCLQPDTRPGIVFDENCVCGACNYATSVKEKIDWVARKAELREIAEWAKSRKAPLGCQKQ